MSMNKVFCTLGLILIVLFVWNKPAYAVTDSHGVTLSSSGTASGAQGFKIYAKDCLDLGIVVKHVSNTSTRSQLLDSSKAVLTSISFSGDNADFAGYDLASGSSYYIVSDNSGSAYTERYAAASYPYNGTNINFTGGISVGSDYSNYIWNLESVNTTTRSCSGTSSTSTSSLDIIMENFYNFAFIILAGVFFFVVAWWWYKMLK